MSVVYRWDSMVVAVLDSRLGVKVTTIVRLRCWSLAGLGMVKFCGLTTVC